MFRKRISTLSLPLLIIGVAIGLAGCAKPEQPVTESSSTTQPSQGPDPLPPPSPPDLSKPLPAEVDAKINSVFRGAVSVDSGRELSFLVGDFNGDLYQDLAVVVKPVDARLDDINSELANWIRDEPLKSVLASPVVLVHKMPSDARIRVARGDVLLAIIHGFGPDGWRSPEATQTYLLRGAVGDGMKTELKKDLMDATKKGATIPSIRGDFLSETLGGRVGYVYYNGAHYVWFDPKSYKEQAAAASSHDSPPSQPMKHSRGN